MENKLIFGLLDIKPSSGKMLLLLFPPIYALWLLAIGKRLLLRQKKSNETFMFFATGTVIFFTIAFILIPLLDIFKIDFLDKNLFNNSIPGLIALLFWVSTIVMVSLITVKYEQKSKPKIYYSFIETLFSTIAHFFMFEFYFISIWFYQSRVNEYNP